MDIILGSRVTLSRASLTLRTLRLAEYLPLKSEDFAWGDAALDDGENFGREEPGCTGPSESLALSFLDEGSK